MIEDIEEFNEGEKKNILKIKNLVFKGRVGWVGKSVKENVVEIFKRERFLVGVVFFIKVEVFFGNRG